LPDGQSWPLAKAILLSLTNQLGRYELLLAHLGRLDREPDLREPFLQDSDTFYLTTTDAIAWYIQAVEGAEPTKTLWEMYYLRERANDLSEDELNRAITAADAARRHAEEPVRGFYRQSREKLLRVVRAKRAERS
jgi:hypothetical protein